MCGSCYPCCENGVRQHVYEKPAVSPEAVLKLTAMLEDQFSLVQERTDHSMIAIVCVYVSCTLFDQ